MTVIVRSNDPAADAKVNAPETKAEVSDVATTSAPVGEKPYEQNESTESDTEESDLDESDSQELGESEGEESEKDLESSDESKDKPQKKKGGFQRRIDKLNARVSAREQELEYWKQQAMKTAGSTKSEPPKVESKAMQADDGKPMVDNFDTHMEYVEALTDWKVDQKEKAREQKSEKAKFESEQAKLIQSHTERVNSFAAKTEDFGEVLSDVDDIPVSPAVREIILQADNGPELMYELAKNRDEYARICKLSPLAAAREMGKLETRIAARTSSNLKPETKKITQAPKPLEPVGTGGKGSVSKSITDPNLSQAEYERLRSEQNKKNRRRV